MEKIFGSSLLSLYHYCILLLLIIILLRTNRNQTPSSPLFFFFNPKNNNLPFFSLSFSIFFGYLPTDAFCAICNFLFPRLFSFFFSTVPCRNASLLGYLPFRQKLSRGLIC